MLQTIGRCATGNSALEMFSSGRWPISGSYLGSDGAVGKRAGVIRNSGTLPWASFKPANSPCLSAR
jgi:hypothetical protein